MTAVPPPRGTVWHIRLRTTESATEAFELVLGRFAGAVSSQARVDDDDWTVEGYADVEPDRHSITTATAALAGDLGIEPPTVRFDLEPTVDWLTHNLEAFPPVSWGRFWVAGTHVAEPPPPGAVPLRIDAGTAFGSGEHPTTGGCLTMIAQHAKARPGIRRVLDLGCGSGILAIAAAKTWRCDVLAADIDPESVRVTRRHADLNGLGHRVDTVIADGYHRAALHRRGPFDLIVANILARPLARLSAGLAANLAPHGSAIVSGLLVRDGPWMAACHRWSGLHVVNRIEIDGWLTLKLQR